MAMDSVSPDKHVDRAVPSCGFSDSSVFVGISGLADHGGAGAETVASPDRSIIGKIRGYRREQDNEFGG